MKYTIFLILFMIILTLIILFIVSRNDKDVYEQYDDIYKEFRKKLNSVNKQVRKNNFQYFQASGETKDKIIEDLEKKLINCSYFYTNDNIYYGHSDLEFNYSHTMGDKVIFSNREFKNIEKSIEENDIVPYEYLLTLIHEFAHIHQRYHKKEYQTFYEKYWDYIFEYIHNSKQLLKYKRQNPDADDDHVIWFDKKTNRYYFINCFYDKINISPYIINVYAYEIHKENNKFVYKNTEPIELEHLTNYNNFFGNIGNNYTPNEIYADYTGMLFDECQNKKQPDYPGYILFKKHYILKNN